MSRCRVSIIVISWNTCSLLRRCLGSILETREDLGVETWVVDNASADGSAEMVAGEFPEIGLLRESENLGFSRAVNRALPRCSGDLVLLLNSDTVLLPGSLGASVAEMDRDPDIDVLGCRLVDESGRVQSSCGVFPSLRTLFWQNLFILVRRAGGDRAVRRLSRLSGVPLMPLRDLLGLWNPLQVREVGWVSGAFLMTRRSVFERVGPLDEAFWLFGEDMDWCRRVTKSGGRVVYDGRTAIVHVGGGSTAEKVESDLRHYRASLRLYRKHHGRSQAAGYRAVQGTAALVRLAALLLARCAGRGKAEFRSRVALEWGRMTLR